VLCYRVQVVHDALIAGAAQAQQLVVLGTAQTAAAAVAAGVRFDKVICATIRKAEKRSTPLLRCSSTLSKQRGWMDDFDPRCGEATPLLSTLSKQQQQHRPGSQATDDL
jgi:hypothetical protein